MVALGKHLIWLHHEVIGIQVPERASYLQLLYTMSANGCAPMSNLMFVHELDTLQTDWASDKYYGNNTKNVTSKSCLMHSIASPIVSNRGVSISCRKGRTSIRISSFSPCGGCSTSRRVMTIVGQGLRGEVARDILFVRIDLPVKKFESHTRAAGNLDCINYLNILDKLEDYSNQAWAKDRTYW